MERLAQNDIPDRLRPLPVLISQLIVAAACSGAMVTARVAVSEVWPGIAPFALIYPAIMIATLTSRWLAGSLTLIVLVLYSWYFELPPRHSFAIEGNVGWLTISTTAGVICVLLAEAIRRAFTRVAQERRLRIEQLQLLFQELDHRVKNNFASVTGLLALQLSQATDQSVRDALISFKGRVEALSRANTHIYAGTQAHDAVDMHLYISELCHAISTGAFPSGAITLNCESAHVMLERDRAVAVGVVVNELVTNALKHAFKDRKHGHIEVHLTESQDSVVLRVSDDGVGFPEEIRKGALGQKLIDGFVQQAGGRLRRKSDESGTTFTLQMGKS